MVKHVIFAAAAGAAALAGGTIQAAQGAQASGTAGQKKAQAPKNVLLILADDMGSMELGCYGSKINSTPNLDALAQSGVRFQTFFATPVSTPSRVELMTGKYGPHTGHLNMSNLPGGKGPYNLATDEYTFGQMFKDAGYTTAMAGKWQLGGKGSTFIFECGFDEYAAWIYLNNLAKGEPYKGGFYPPKSQKTTSRYWQPGIMVDGEHIATTKTDYGPDIYSKFIMDFIKKSAAAGKPFFAYYPMALVHSPWVATPDHPEVKDNSPEAFKANVEYADKIVGRLVKTLDDAGVRKNTLVIFLGDNGTEGWGKQTVTEWGPHTPCMISLPGTIKAGVVSGEMVDLSDILPTMVDYAGFRPRNFDQLDGKSLWPFLTGVSATTKPYAISYYGQYRVIRDKEWLLESNMDGSLGELYHCGTARNGLDYQRADFSQPDAVAARERFENYIKTNCLSATMSDADKRSFTEFVEKHRSILMRDLDTRYKGPYIDANRAWVEKGKAFGKGVEVED